jgi:hypothetical protein
MEAEVGTPIEYNAREFDMNINDKNDEEEIENNEDKEYYAPPPHHYYHQPPPDFMLQQQAQTQKAKDDIFANLDKTGYIIIFVAFLLGFFMGKTMQPVILRPG